MIKLSNNSWKYRIPSTIAWFFPVLIVLLPLMRSLDDPRVVLISLAVIFILVSLNVYINFCDYNVFYDANTDELIVKRFKMEERFANYKDMKIAYWGALLPVGSRRVFYLLEISNMRFRFRYPYLSKEFLNFKNFDLDGYSKEVREDIINKIAAANENQTGIDNVEQI